MKYLVIPLVLTLVGCTEPMVNIEDPSSYEECLTRFKNTGYGGMAAAIANNFKYAKEIREDAKHCIDHTAKGNGKTNKEDDIRACTVHAYSINGGISPETSQWDAGYSFNDVYGEVVLCRQKFNVPEGQ